MSGDGHEIRPEAAEDIDAIRRVIVAAFGAEAEARLVDALRAADALAVSLVAEVGGALVGHVGLSPVTVDGAEGAGRWLGLAPLAVAPAYQRRGIGGGPRGAGRAGGRGIGGDLVRAAVAAAAANGAAAVFVVGRSTYYGRLGFAEAAGLGWRCELDVPAPAFRVCRLAPAARLPPPGTVAYHPAFATL